MNGSFEPDIASQVMQKNIRDSDLLKGLLDFDDTIETLEHLLRNERFDSANQKWSPRGQPFLNEDGVNSIVAIVQTHLNNVFMITNFDEDDVRRIAEEVGHGVIVKLYLKYQDWEVDVSNLSIIVNIVDHFTYAMLKSSLNEGIRNLLKLVEKREVRIREEPEKKKSWIPFIGGG